MVSEMPGWLYIGLISIESLLCFYVLYVAFMVCILYPEYVFKKVPMTCFYIFAILGISVNVCFIWYGTNLFSVETKTVLILYLSAVFCHIALQHCLLMNLCEFYLQVKVLTQGNFLTQSVLSDFKQSLIGNETEVGYRQKQNKIIVTLILICLLMIDLALYGTALYFLIKSPDTPDQEFKIVQMVMAGITNANLIAYFIMTVILKKFFKDQFNGRFNSKMKPIILVCYLLFLQSIVEIVNLTITILYEDPNDTLMKLLLQIQETVMPYISLLIPCLIIFRQHLQVFAKKDNRDRNQPIDTSVILV